MIRRPGRTALFKKRRRRNVDRIDQFTSQLFAPYPPQADVQEAKKQVTAWLRERLNALLAEGVPQTEAEDRVLMEFGAKEGAQAAILQCRTQRSYQAFRRRYPWMVRGGLLALAVLPAAAALLFRDAEKAGALAAWTLAIIAGVTFVIAVEYIDYRYQRAQQEHRTTLDRLVHRGDLR